MVSLRVRNASTFACRRWEAAVSLSSSPCSEVCWPCRSPICEVTADRRVSASLLQATSEQIDRAALPPEGMPALQRQLQAIRRELEQTVSPPLAAELQRIVPPQEEAPSAGALRIQCAVLLGWAGSLVIQVLSALADARERLSGAPAVAGSLRAGGDR